MIYKKVFLQNFETDRLSHLHLDMCIRPLFVNPSHHIMLTLTVYIEWLYVLHFLGAPQSPEDLPLHGLI